MAEKERITDPTSGSNELGSETEKISGTGVSAGTDTQTQMAALSAQRKKDKKNVDKSATRTQKKDLNFPEANETDE